MLSEPRIIYGIHSFTPVRRSNGLPYGILKVLGGSSMALSGELIKLNAGSSQYPWAVEDGVITAEISLRTKSYPDFLFEIFLGKAPTANAAETGGSITTLSNKLNSSAVDGTTGMASVAITTAADVKFGRYTIKVASATTVDVYLASDIDISRGTDAAYQDDDLKITVSALTIANTGATVEIPNTGVTITSGSGTVSMTTGDTATFRTRPINTKSMDVGIGSTSDLPAEFSALMIAQQRGNAEQFELFAHKCKGVGMPIGLEENAFSEAEIKIEAFYDSVENEVFAVRHVTPS